MKTIVLRPRDEIATVLRRNKRGVARVAIRARVSSSAVSQWIAGRTTSQNIWKAADLITAELLDEEAQFAKVQAEFAGQNVEVIRS